MSTAIREAAYGDACALRARRETEVLLEERVREKRRTRPLFYALLLGGTALCAAAGLFAGMLLPYSAAAMAVAGRDTAMGSSLFGMAVELLRGSLPAADSVYAAVLQGLLLFLVGAATLSLLSSAIAFAAGRTARKLFAFSSTLVLFGYTAFSALVLLGAETLREALPLDALAACAGTLLFRLLSALFGAEGERLIDEGTLLVHGQKETLLIDLHRFEARLRKRRNDKRDVGLSRPHEVFKFARGAFLKGDFDSRMRRAEDGEHLRQKEHLPVFRRPDHHASAPAPVDVLHRPPAVLADFRDALFRFKEDPARFRQGERTRGAVEDFGAQVLLDSLHELRERGLRDAERLGGFGDAAGGKDGGEVAVGLGVHGERRRKCEEERECLSLVMSGVILSKRGNRMSALPLKRRIVAFALEHSTCTGGTESAGKLQAVASTEGYRDKHWPDEELTGDFKLRG